MRKLGVNGTTAAFNNVFYNEQNLKDQQSFQQQQVNGGFSQESLLQRQVQQFDRVGQTPDWSLNAIESLPTEEINAQRLTQIFEKP